MPRSPLSVVRRPRPPLPFRLPTPLLDTHFDPFLPKGAVGTIIADWLAYLHGPLNEVRANAVRLSLHTGSRVNRPTGWASSPGPPAV